MDKKIAALMNEPVIDRGVQVKQTTPSEPCPPSDLRFDHDNLRAALLVMMKNAGTHIPLPENACGNIDARFSGISEEKIVMIILAILQESKNPFPFGIDDNWDFRIE